MTIHVTSRHFKAHPSLHGYAEKTVEQLSRYYDGITKADVILSYEKARNSLKMAEINVHVYGTDLTGMAKTNDFFKSIDVAIHKVLAQLKKYKERLHAKNRKEVRKILEKA